MNDNKDAQKKFRIEEFPAGMTRKNPVAMLATWFGSGLVRPAPGTIGSLAALPVGYVIQATMGVYGMALAALLITIVGVMAADRYSKASGKKDDQSIVIDEVAGLWIAAIPAGTSPELWAIAFLLFRIFDIYKPWPASFFDKRGKGGLDIMLDDVIAGIFAFLGTASGALAMMLQQ